MTNGNGWTEGLHDVASRLPTPLATQRLAAAAGHFIHEAASAAFASLSDRAIDPTSNMNERFPIMSPQPDQAPNSGLRHD